MSRAHHDDLLKQVEEQQARYLRSLRELHDVSAIHGTEERSTGTDTPPIRPVQATPTFANELMSFPTGGSRRTRRLTNETGERRPSGLRNTPASLQSVDIDSSDEEDLQYLSPSQATPGMSHHTRAYVQQPLPKYSFSDHELLSHLQSARFGDAAQTALDDVYQKRGELDKSTMFQAFDDRHDKLYDSATYEVYEIGRDGAAKSKHAAEDNDTELILDAKTVWDTIKHVNFDGDAVGRMTDECSSLLDPSPLMLGAIHMTMGRHFDMDELFQHLVTIDGNKGKTKAYMNRAFEQTALRQRSCFFVFKYYTIVGEKFTPAPWQQYDNRPADKRSLDHIDISECSSILGLSLAGEPIRTFERKKKRAKAEIGKVYDPFAPWQLLNIQCFPDDEHVMRNEDSRSIFRSGPFAFLDSLAMEYRDAAKRNIALNDSITKLIHPPIKFMFDWRLRDKLLFEDKHFTYSRRYFWAYNTLGVINEGIKSMVSAYTDTFTKDFWAGRDPALFPHPDASHSSPDFHLYVSKLRPLRHDLEAALSMLRQVYEKNEDTRQEIKSLRDQLFSGSSVKESRRAIEQGDNIKILTSLSMIFLPLTFVTSVWSMTGFPLDVDDWQFPATMICACVPFLLFVCMLQTTTGMGIFTKAIERLDDGIKGLGTRLGKKRDARGPSSTTVTVKGTVGNTSPTAELRPRRKRRFSRREGGPTEDGIGPSVIGASWNKGWQWWRKGERVKDGQV
ncbi:hypothetical protein BJ170DRAFT_594999 [Xylariales sp. AK1849]|nr:hypothetical protein BJ170DRAFT_594999 [Xylariales sp. AK1849]